MKCVGDGDDIGGEDGGDPESDDWGEVDGVSVGYDGGDTDAKRPVLLKSSGLVERFSGSSVKNREK